MRSVKVTINGTEYNMPVNFKVSKEIAEAVGDPLTLAIESHKLGAVPFDSGQVVDVIAIGAKAAGCSLSTDAIGEHIFEANLIDYVHVAGEYIGAFVSGGPNKPIPTGNAKKKKPRAG